MKRPRFLRKKNTPQQDKAGVVAVELSVAAVEILRLKHGWSKEKCNQFLDDLMAQAKRNRKELELMLK